jgi:regulatory protein
LARNTPDLLSSQAAYLVGLRWLAARELSSGQVRERLNRRGFAPQAIEDAIRRLIVERALNDRRAAIALARTEVTVRQRGPHRVLRRLLAMPIDRDLAKDVVREVFGDVDESALIERALAKRLRRTGGRITDAAQRRKLHAQLVRQGFSSSAAASHLRSRTRKGKNTDDE